MTTTDSVSINSGSRHRLWRSRWAAIGAAVAVAVGAGGIYVGHAADSSPASSFVVTGPSRILDTRNNIGLNGPFTSLTSRDLLVTGLVPTTTGDEIVVPAGASAVALNVTVVSPTASGFLSIRAADALGTPSTSSLNFIAGELIPNAVTVKLPTTGPDAGKIEITYNAFDVPGPTTHVLVDVVGYYLLNEPSTTLVLGAAGFIASNSGVVYTDGCVRGATSTTVRMSIPLPVGVVLTGISAWIFDGNANTGEINLTKMRTGLDTIATASTTGSAGFQRLTAVPINFERVEVGEYFAFEYIGGDLTPSHLICGVEIDYSE